MYKVDRLNDRVDATREFLNDPMLMRSMQLHSTTSASALPHTLSSATTYWSLFRMRGSSVFR
jgi:hypothetical protein